ncbi:MAG: hypothetical protein O7G13_13890 [Alphaproteobacteria bacterium]|nr:hypothetical protein [Alphaproteobacteria bacterium]MCZ6840355.1 hypothetical protein [Alphaproteobacteria bacterium]MCZ6846292.1 hypothetical protein [Alphaproteobacteria bacterium]
MSARADPRGSKAPIELRLAVWQFVRIMVQLETASRARGRRSAPSLYGAWRSAWQEVDRRLTELGKTDTAGFSDLMMEQEVVLQCRGRAQLNELMRTLDNVVNQLKAEIKAASGDARQMTDLRFERTELETLGRRLRKLAKSSGHDEPRPRAKSTGRRGAAR